MEAAVLPISRGGNRPVWLVTLADLVALLLTFFVLIFSMSTIHSDRWDAIAEGLPAGSPAIVPATETAAGAESNIDTIEFELGIDLRYLESILGEHLLRDPVMAEAVVSRIHDALVISVPAHLLFASGSDALTSRAKPALFRLGGLLANLKNEVAIIGHTDPEPIATLRFPSNWELSLSRALTVAGSLRQAGYRRDVEVLGVADARFADISPALDESRRRALGRRVDVLIRDTKEH